MGLGGGRYGANPDTGNDLGAPLHVEVKPCSAYRVYYT